MSDPEGIRWPARFHPNTAPIHVRNSMVIAAAPEAIWNAPIAAPHCPEFYPNARDVVLEDGRTDLTCGARFKWATFGFRTETVVEEFEPPNRIAWRADGIGVSADHAWLIVPHRDGSRNRYRGDPARLAGPARRTIHAAAHVGLASAMA